MSVRDRILVMHGVNLDMLGRRPADHYGDLNLDGLQFRIDEFADALGLQVQFFQSNHEGEFVEKLHRVDGLADGLLLNPGAWTHYSWAIRDALEIARMPAVEVHISDVNAREKFRRTSVIRDLCIGVVSGKGVDGYRDALELLKAELEKEG